MCHYVQFAMLVVPDLALSAAANHATASAGLVSQGASELQPEHPPALYAACLPQNYTSPDPLS